MKRGGKKRLISAPAATDSSRSRSTITAAMEPDRSEPTKDSSSYFPGCRKDANCSCEICLASINATLDLKSLSTKKPYHHSRPIPAPLFSDSASPSAVATPQISVRRRLPSSPCLKSTARVGFKDAVKEVVISEEDVNQKNEKNRSKYGKLVLCFVVLILGFYWMESSGMQPELSAEVVREFGERGFSVDDINGKLRMIQSELQQFVHSPVSNCSFNTPAWKINQDGLLLRTECVLYESAAEKVSIWGWPLQTAGLLASSFSSRSFTILSGRVTQWPEGNAGYGIMKASGSWVQDKYRESAVHLDAQTWVLEYSKSALLEHEGYCSATWEFLMYKLSRVRVWNMKMNSLLGWLVALLRGYSAVDGDYAHPT